MDRLKALKITAGVGGGILAILFIAPTMFGDFLSQSNEALLAQNPNNPGLRNYLDAVIDDRRGLYQATLLRTFIFMLITIAILWFHQIRKFDKRIVIAVIGVLVLTDLWLVDREYINTEERQDPATGIAVQGNFGPDNYYDIRMARAMGPVQSIPDPDIHFRVMNYSQGITGDGVTPYYFNSIGGYHGAKLRRIQELFDWYGSDMQTFNNIFSMLNVKYLIQGQQYFGAQVPPMGNAWVVGEIQEVKDSDEEIRALQTLNPRSTALVQTKYMDKFKGVQSGYDSSATITLTSYDPRVMEYTYSGSKTNLVVFSEIFYRGNLDWKAYIDGNYVEHGRVNYLLRGLEVPAGQHTITFKFEPNTYYRGRKIAGISSLLGVLLVLGLLFMHVRENTDWLAGTPIGKKQA